MEDNLIQKILEGIKIFKEEIKPITKFVEISKVDKFKTEEELEKYISNGKRVIKNYYGWLYTAVESNYLTRPEKYCLSEFYNLVERLENTTSKDFLKLYDLRKKIKAYKPKNFISSN